MTLIQINLMNNSAPSQSATECAQCPIRHRAVCAKCDEDELVLLEDMKRYQSFKVGETIIWRGEPLEFVASVVSGVATLSKTMEDGRTQMVGLLLPSDFIGRPGRATIDFDVVAADDVTLCCFQRAQFEHLVQETPHIAERLMELALDELDAARDWMVLLGRKTAREKICTFIEMLSRRLDPEKSTISQQIDLHMTRDQIADYLGLTLETVSRQFNGLKKEKIINFSDRRHFTITDLAALHDQTGDDADGGIVF